MYCIDTSSLIHCWRRDYPPDVFASLWENIDILIDNNTLFAPEEVLHELDRGGDDLYEWAKNRKSMFISSDYDIQIIVSDIVNRHPKFLPETSYTGVWADPYVVALAYNCEAYVITGEKRVGPNAKQLKIPNICDFYNIECVNVLEMIRHQRWSF
ncbi:DUF4411 family protein [Natranaerobius thermophilus]|uniref:DUF4411 family protein n=1 Tax=Natranaerobius thermophilus (strain ATCC BAA-1301 / DSM 18059 / JW/NM-WN-LF) TaxID=457570 RepID=B2A1E0_NATTJ|nr:DUF4411 family protein [Natranaerobius thermophilus]ACB86078.1 conserved hypothetical protein [Natranaerobius thermophilus JW/NM-WN-LF]